MCGKRLAPTDKRRVLLFFLNPVSPTSICSRYLSADSLGTGPHGRGPSAGCGGDGGAAVCAECGEAAHLWSCASLQILRRMKGLALDAETELERQDEALDGMATAVDRATLTIDKHNRRMRKLM